MLKKIATIVGIILAILTIASIIFWAGYRYRDYDISRKSGQAEIKRPEFTSDIISSLKMESGLWESKFIIKNVGNGSATIVKVWIESDVKIEMANPLMEEIGMSEYAYRRNYENGQKIYRLEFDMLLPSQELPIIFQTKEKPYLKLKNWIYPETADKESIEKLKD